MAAATELWMLVLARLLTGAGEAAMFVGVATAASTSRRCEPLA
jgi:hypothetical protein